MDDLSIQRDEFEVLESIYGNDWFVDSKEEGLYHINIESSNIQITLLLQFPPNYPSKSPPFFDLLTTDLDKNDKEELSNILQDLYGENVGATIVYQWVERIREWIQKKTEVWLVEEKFAEEDKKHHSVSAFGAYGNYASDEEVLCADMQENVRVCDDSTPVKVEEVPPPFDPQPKETPHPHLHIIHGDPLTFKKSTFQGHAAVITDPKDVKFFVKELMANKKIAHATHNIQAYRIFKERNNTFEEHFEDDREKQAGHRLLHLMQMMDVRNVVVTVSRWYGGVHLGPDRFRLINNAAKEVLEKGSFIHPPEGRKKK